MTLEERLAAICEHELLTPATHDFLVSVLGVLTEAKEALEPFAKKAGQPLEMWRLGENEYYRCSFRGSDLTKAVAALDKFSASPVLPVNQGPPASAPPQR